MKTTNFTCKHDVPSLAKGSGKTAYLYIPSDYLETNPSPSKQVTAKIQLVSLLCTPQTLDVSVPYIDEKDYVGDIAALVSVMERIGPKNVEDLIATLTEFGGDAVAVMCQNVNVKRALGLSTLAGKDYFELMASQRFKRWKPSI